MPNLGMPNSSPLKGISLGNGTGTGIGSGNGSGIGPGSGGNIGGGVMHIGGGVQQASCALPSRSLNSLRRRARRSSRGTSRSISGWEEGR